MAWSLGSPLLLDSGSLEKVVTRIQMNRLQTHLSVTELFLFKYESKSSLKAFSFY